MRDGSPVMLWPAFALVALTAIVWVRVFVVRVAEMRRLRIHPQSVALSAQALARFVDTRAADNLRNLFELPVLFYFAMAVAAILHVDDPVLLALAWTFVAARVAHSAIHCGHNRVMHRFVAYFGGGIVLWLAWAVLAWDLLRRHG